MTTTRACPNCGAQNAPAQRFCGSCGAPLGEQPSTDEVVERRWATVLFGDLSGFTTLS
ncbi:MAG: zinc-ribbon domain-containing protein, partial [Actinomycetota bacterium]